MKRLYWDRLWYVAAAIRRGISEKEIFDLTWIDPWFLHNIKEIVDMEKRIESLKSLQQLDEALFRKAKQFGFSDIYLSRLLKCSESEVSKARNSYGIVPVYKRVDTCAAEFEAHTPYLYSTYEDECESAPSSHKK